MTEAPTPQQRPIPHHEWGINSRPDPQPDSEIDHATEAYEAAQRILKDDHPAKPAIVARPQSPEDREYDHLDDVSGLNPREIRRKVGLED